jgi:hypothetical protein
MQLISGFVDVYLELNAAEEEVFQAVVDTMGLTEQEVYMEILTSWERKAIQVERRATITKILKLRFGDIDASLEGIIPALLQLSPDEYMDSLLQADREELLSRFQG